MIIFETSFSNSNNSVQFSFYYKDNCIKLFLLLANTPYFVINSFEVSSLTKNVILIYKYIESII